MNWRKKLENFLFSPEKALISRDGVVPETAALLLLRSAYASDKTLVAALPDAAKTEKIVSELEELQKLTGRKLKTLAIPECGRGKLLFPGGEAGRARALNRILNEKFDLICGSVHALLGAAPPPDESAEGQLELRPGMNISIQKLLSILVKLDYDDEVNVTVSGEFARHGGIVDIFSPAHDEPCRIEFFGDEIDSMRFFAPETQRSTGKAESYRIINRAGITAGGAADSDAFAYIERMGDFRLLDIWRDAGEEILAKYSVPGAIERWESIRSSREHFSFSELPSGTSALPADAEAVFAAESADKHPGRAIRRREEIISQLLKERINKFAVHTNITVFLASDEEDVPMVKEWCIRHGLAVPDAEFDTAPLHSSFVLEDAGLLVLNEHALSEAGFVRTLPAEEDTQSIAGSEIVSPVTDMANAVPEFSLTDFEEGDYVVHLDFGIAIYRGLKRERGGESRELMTLEFRDGKILYVPLIQANRISRYLGAPGRVKLHALGGVKWNADKESVRHGVRSYAADMLRFQAVREATPGIVFNCDAREYRKFLRAFPFKDTTCQTRATSEISKDMITPKPMDRLLCGDVGYGKTEIAMRAAFQAVSAGYQVALIAPTTVLAQQHFRSFQERFKEYPFTIDTVSRFRTAQEQLQIIGKLATGGIDILIGTHRICGESFKFRNLGLVIIDEEQRFGVNHKERLRRFRVEADVLSMSATPIPRTLYLAMAGARDLSTLMTPPKLRLPVKTVIAPQEDNLIANAIKAELARGGQVYYLHNRVATIDHCAEKLQTLLPGAKIAVGHGQMPEEQLSEVMTDFLEGRTDVLVCSTIIESGLDVPNANTIIIERADRFGLAELYQLRGRVGRWKHQAYAYMLLPKDGLTGSAARKRLAAIRRCSTLGSGFQLALRDLEIRGSGNLLGSEQSGHLNMIGFDLYCRLLKQEISMLRGGREEVFEEPEVGIDFIKFALRAPENCAAAAFTPEYIENESLRIAAYRKLASLRDKGAVDDFAEELADRFGKLPQEAKILLSAAKLKIATAQAGFRRLNVANGTVSLSNPGGTVYRERGKIPRLDPRDPPELRICQLMHIINQAAGENKKRL